MPLHRFNLEDRRFIANGALHDCMDETHAQEIGNEIGDRLVQAEPELLHGGHAIVVRNAEDRPIYRVEMDAVSTVRRRHWNGNGADE